MLQGLFLILVSSALVNNFVLSRFLGICPFLGVSQKVETAVSMGWATTLVMTVSAVVTWTLERYFLLPLGLEFLRYVVYILVIASMVQTVETVLAKTSPALHRSLGIFLPLITTNCAVLGLALLVSLKGYNIVEAAVFAVGAGLGFTLALSLLAGIRERLEWADIPAAFKGAPIVLITAGLLSMAFLGFTGLVAQ
ncbi:MAG: electron transport complex subunit RsxA [Firmicutes bacterium]|nr:electron transport complex subunit RsxA [Bacillota bacterium]